MNRLKIRNEYCETGQIITLLQRDVNSPKNQLTQKPTRPSCDQLTQIDWSTHPSFWSTHPSFEHLENTSESYFSFKYIILIIKAMLYSH